MKYCVYTKTWEDSPLFVDNNLYSAVSLLGFCYRFSSTRMNNPMSVLQGRIEVINENSIYK